jgi:hypothetical protein
VNASILIGATLLVWSLSVVLAASESHFEAQNTPTATGDTASRVADDGEKPSSSNATGDAVAASVGDWIVKRVGGDRDADITVAEGVYRFGRMAIEAPLPEAYPPPTPPKAIDLKRYPEVRRAEIDGTAYPDRGASSAFWPLFQHIKSREIAMTSPVEMDYRDWSAGDSRTPREWTMSFLYRTADLGPTGKDGSIRVVDAEPITVISIGMRGAYGLASVEAGLAELERWLAGQDEWIEAGDPRALNYNGPYVAARDKWSEVQIPVRMQSEQVARPSRPDTPSDDSHGSTPSRADSD